jgi:hypothetical protein
VTGDRDAGGPEAALGALLQAERALLIEQLRKIVPRSATRHREAALR